MLINLEASMLIKSIKALRKYYFYFKDYLFSVYRDSKLYRRFYLKIKVYFKYSLFGRIGNIKQMSDDAFNENAFLNEVKTIKYLMGAYKIFKNKLFFLFYRSKISSSLGGLKKEMYVMPVKIIGIIIIIVVLANTFFSILWKEKIYLSDCIIRILFLFLGIYGSFRGAGLTSVKNNSIFLNLFSKRCAGSAAR